MARSPLTDETLRQKLRPFLMTVKGTDAAVVEEFMERCSYRPVATYDDVVRCNARMTMDSCVLLLSH